MIDSFDIFYVASANKLSNKQPSGRLFETTWRSCNVTLISELHLWSSITEIAKAFESKSTRHQFRYKSFGSLENSLTPLVRVNFIFELALIQLLMINLTRWVTSLHTSTRHYVPVHWVCIVWSYILALCPSVAAPYTRNLLVVGAWWRHCILPIPSRLTGQGFVNVAGSDTWRLGDRPRSVVS